MLVLEKGLEESFEKADALEKAWSGETRFSIPELLRARLSDLSPSAYAAALIALERCEKRASPPTLRQGWRCRC